MADSDPLVLGRDNSAESFTILRRTATGGDTDPVEALIVDNPLGNGVAASAGFAGVVGDASSGPGIFGRTTSPRHGGTQGFNLDGLGVAGISRGGVGVLGRTTQGGTGVLGTCGGANGVGVHGVDPLRLGLAGLFDGQVRVLGTFVATGTAFVDTLNAGTIQAQSKLFRIEHPLDPANKYLCHTAVESPDMKNVYDGLVTLDVQGAATVQLPEWVEA